MRATGIVMDILRRLDTISGLIPKKRLIQLQQQNVMVGGAVTLADLLREAMDGAGEWSGRGQGGNPSTESADRGMPSGNPDAEESESY